MTLKSGTVSCLADGKEENVNFKLKPVLVSDQYSLVVWFMRSNKPNWLLTTCVFKVELKRTCTMCTINLIESKESKKRTEIRVIKTLRLFLFRLKHYKKDCL